MIDLYFRICNKDKNGLWYNQEGKFTGLIHNKELFNSSLEMPFDEEVVGWLSVASSLEELLTWFPISNVLKLQKEGYFIGAYEAIDVKFYEKFKHHLIKQDTSKLIQKIIFS